MVASLLLRDRLTRDVRQNGTPCLCPATGEGIFARGKIGTENGTQHLDFPDLLVQLPDLLY